MDIFKEALFSLAQCMYSGWQNIRVIFTLITNNSNRHSLTLSLDQFSMHNFSQEWERSQLVIELIIDINKL